MASNSTKEKNKISDLVTNEKQMKTLDFSIFLKMMLSM